MSAGGLHAAEFCLSRTCHEMIVDHASRLHPRLADCWANKFESAWPQIAAHCAGLGRARRHVGHASPAIPDWFASDEAPQVSIESPKFFANSGEYPGVFDRGRDF